MIRFEINCPPFSTNRLWRIGKWGNWYKTREAKDWEDIVFLSLPRATSKRIQQMKKKSFGLKVAFYTSNVKRKDLDNMLKLFIDTLAKKYGFNDKQIHYIEAIKYESGEEKIIGELFEV